ncbi:MAG TPA: ATP-binding protein [Verrucomicrobiae bacterium]|nr:ATP-binding protein [Verrucomicrobiae bacterium]
MNTPGAAPGLLQRAWRYAASVGAVGLVIALYHLGLRANNTTVALTLLMVILGVSARWGLAEATVAAVVAVLGFNFYFLEPIGRLTIEDPQNWVAFGAFLVTAITASQLSAYARRRTAESESRRVEIEKLYALLQEMSLTGSPRRTVREFVHRVVQIVGCGAAAFYYSPTGDIVRSGPELDQVADRDLIAAAALDEGVLDAALSVFTAPVRLGGRSLGSMALAAPLPAPATLRALVNLVAITLEKARALEDASHAEAAHQSEVLKSALLDSLAHDIKTPLTSIKAAVTSLLGDSQTGAPESDEKRELLTIINEEADRLNRLAAETIAMARVDAGKLHLEKQPLMVTEMIDAALSELAGQLRGRQVSVKAEPGLPSVEADAESIQEVVRHLIENALKYSPGDSPIAISVARKGGRVVVGVADRGPGIEENERMRIFDRFYRGRRHRFDTRGTGMGLAIAKGIVEAHGERIWVESEKGQGSAFYFSLPVV